MPSDRLRIDGVILPMRANEPYVNNTIRVVDPNHDAILVASDIEYRAAVLEDAGRANVTFDVRRRGPVGRFATPSRDRALRRRRCSG